MSDGRRVRSPKPAYARLGMLGFAVLQGSSGWVRNIPDVAKLDFGFRV